MTVNHLVAGSSPAEAAKFWGRSINGDAADCKSAGSAMPSSILGYPTKVAPLAHLVEQLICNQ